MRARWRRARRDLGTGARHPPRAQGGRPVKYSIEVSPARLRPSRSRSPRRSCTSRSTSPTTTTSSPPLSRRRASGSRIIAAARSCSRRSCCVSTAGSPRSACRRAGAVGLERAIPDASGNPQTLATDQYQVDLYSCRRASSPRLASPGRSSIPKDQFGVGDLRRRLCPRRCEPDRLRREHPGRIKAAMKLLLGHWYDTARR
jgi:hypothetical protein